MTKARKPKGLYERWMHDSDFRYTITRFVTIVVLVGVLLGFVVSSEPEIPLLQRAIADQSSMALNAIGVESETYRLWIDAPVASMTSEEESIFVVGSARLGLDVLRENGALVGRGQPRTWAQMHSLQDFAYSLRSRGLEVDLQPAVIVTPKVTVKIIPACSAWVGIAAIIGLILAFPGGTRKGKLYGIVLAMTGLYVVNILRLVSTIALTNWYGQWVFDLMHVFLWREAMVGIALVGWVVWLKWLANID